jgi:hypothetical protein
MKEWLAFILPPAAAFAGMRISRLVLGQKLEERFGLGLRFALGLAVGMLVFSQLVLLTALAGINATGLLAWTAIIWGVMEVGLMSPKLAAGFRQIKFQPAHLWLLLLLPVLYSWWIFGRLCTLEGTLEFDANAFWVFKAKILYLEQGKNLVAVLHQSNLGYAHMDYPMLVPCLYALDYGLVNGVDEYVNKIWPFWMMVALCLAILSLARVWKRPHPLPLLTVVFLCFLPASLQFIRNEGGTIPMVFFISMTALLMVTAMAYANEIALTAGILVLAGCANTKFEGIIYTALWGSVALLFCWRRGWLKSRLLWKTILVAAICMVPYFCFRLAKPVLHPESGWMHDGITSPGTALRRFPQTFSLNIGSRFFSQDFFHWQTADKDHVQWAGQWSGWNSLVNRELSILPWLLLFLFAFSIWRKKRHRLALGILVGVIVAQFTILSFVISCLANMQADVAQVIDFSSNVVGRYYYPFFTAGFLGIMAAWFVDRDSLNPSPPVEAAKVSNPISTVLQPRSKKRR